MDDDLFKLFYNLSRKDPLSKIKGIPESRRTFVFK